jgi:hypothetical protein
MSVSEATPLPPSAQHAAQLQLFGDFAAARQEVHEVLVQHPSDASALFVAACLALEAGFSGAEEYVSALERLSPPPPQAAVLRALIARRRLSPGEPIDDAAILAWKTVGRPDLASSPLLPPLASGISSPPKIPASTRQAMTAGEQLIFGEGGDPDQAERLALLASAHPEQNLLVVNIEILSVLTYAPKDPEMAEKRAAAAGRVGPLVSATDPGNGYLALLAFLASDPADPLSARDLDQLEEAIGKPQFKMPRQRMLGELKSTAQRLDLRYSEIHARMAALRIPVPLVALWKRADATTDPVLRRRASALLMAAGKRLEASGAFLERMLAMVLMTHGARLSGDEHLLAETRSRAQQVREALDAMRAAHARFGTWPFARWFRDLDPEQELERFQRFL